MPAPTGVFTTAPLRLALRVAVLAAAASRTHAGIIPAPAVWHGPAALVWHDNCPTVKEMGNASLPGTVHVEDCEAACTQLTGQSPPLVTVTAAEGWVALLGSLGLPHA